MKFFMSLWITRDVTQYKEQEVLHIVTHSEMNLMST